MTPYGPPTAQEHLREGMLSSKEWQARHQPLDRAPVYGGEDIIKPSRFPWGIVILAVIGLGFSLFLFGYANASEPTRVWVIWDTAKNEPYHPHRFVSPTACNTDIAHAKDGSGKRLSCVRIDQRKEQ